MWRREIYRGIPNEEESKAVGLPIAGAGKSACENADLFPLIRILALPLDRIPAGQVITTRPANTEVLQSVTQGLLA